MSKSRLVNKPCNSSKVQSVSFCFIVQYTLTMADRIKIITLMEQNMSQVDVANILHVNQSIVCILWRKSVADRPREGCPCKTTPGQDKYVRLSARRNPKTSATTLRHELREATGIVVSSQTVRNGLHDIGLYARRSLKTPALRPHHRGLV